MRVLKVFVIFINGFLSKTVIFLLFCRTFIFLISTIEITIKRIVFLNYFWKIMNYKYGKIFHPQTIINKNFKKWAIEFLKVFIATVAIVNVDHNLFHIFYISK